MVACYLANRPHPNPLPEGEWTKPRGAILIVVLVCLMLATAMFVLVVRQALTQRQAMEISQRCLQASWLAEAGLERAAARLAADPKYAGETWTLSAAELAAGEGGVVKIEVKAITDRPERRLVRVQADYPDAPEHRCRQVKEIVVDRDAIRSRGRT